MAIIRKMIYENEPLTTEQLKQIEEADKKPVVFDEDCQELTEQQHILPAGARPLPASRQTMITRCY